RITGKCAQQPGEILARRRRVFEARRELREQRSELSRRRNRVDASTKLVEVRRGRPGQLVQRRRAGARAFRKRLRDALLVHARVRELLIQLERELEVVRRTRGPAARDVRARLTVK